MIKVIINGAGGHMGRVVDDICKTDSEVEVVAGIDPAGGNFDFPVFKSLRECSVTADVVIDFSTASCIDDLLDAAVVKNLPVVLCTTGLNEATTSHMHKASDQIAILKSANMSVGINLFLNLLKEATEKLSTAGYDIEIVEKHHRRKLDAPSGTAIALADSINEAAAGRYEYVYDRSERRMARPQNEIGISAVRGGTIVGEHEIIFAGEDEVITFKHSAYSRNIFAKGAVVGAKYLVGKKPGIYTMQDALK